MTFWQNARNVSKNHQWLSEVHLFFAFIPPPRKSTWNHQKNWKSPSMQRRIIYQPFILRFQPFIFWGDDNHLLSDDNHPPKRQGTRPRSQASSITSRSEPSDVSCMKFQVGESLEGWRFITRKLTFPWKPWHFRPWKWMGSWNIIRYPQKGALARPTFRGKLAVSFREGNISYLGKGKPGDLGPEDMPIVWWSQYKMGPEPMVIYGVTGPL